MPASAGASKRTICRADPCPDTPSPPCVLCLCVLSLCVLCLAPPRRRAASPPNPLAPGCTTTRPAIHSVRKSSPCGPSTWDARPGLASISRHAACSPPGMRNRESPGVDDGGWPGETGAARPQQAAWRTPWAPEAHPAGLHGRQVVMARGNVGVVGAGSCAVGLGCLTLPCTTGVRGGLVAHRRRTAYSPRIREQSQR